MKPKSTADFGSRESIDTPQKAREYLLAVALDGMVEHIEFYQQHGLGLTLPPTEVAYAMRVHDSGRKWVGGERESWGSVSSDAYKAIRNASRRATDRPLYDGAPPLWWYAAAGSALPDDKVVEDARGMWNKCNVKIDGEVMLAVMGTPK